MENLLSTNFVELRKQLCIVGEALAGEACLDPIGITDVFGQYAKAMEAINNLEDGYKAFRSHL